MGSITKGDLAMSQQPDARPDARLDAQPSELLTMIAEQLSEKCDLQSLRLVSLSLCGAATKPFCKFFNHRRHVVSKHSLEALLEIVQHPVFGPYVQSVSLGTAVLSPPNVALSLDLNKVFCTHQELVAMDIISPVLQNFLEHQRFLESQESDSLLKRVFTLLKGTNNRIALGLFDDCLRAGYGSDKCYADF